MRQKSFFKAVLPYLLAIAFFAVLSVGYFAPDIFQGKEMLQGDVQQGTAIGKELVDYKAEHGERTRWTNSLFGGMPTYQIDPVYTSTDVMLVLAKIFSLGLPSPASLLFIMLLGFFLLMKSLKIRTDLSVLGAILYTFSSYFFIIIEAGHLWKFMTLSYVPPFIAGIIWAYNKRYFLGAAVAAVSFAMQLVNNHIQMTYYFFFVELAIVIAFFIDAYRKKEMKSFFKASGVLIIAVLIGVSINLPNLYHTYEYSKESMRGPTVLTPEASENATSSGLDRDYIVAWSYGIGETFTFLVPNTKGGATGYLGDDKTAMKTIKTEYKQSLAGMNHYWGDQPFTSGPVYVGAFVLFLAILALFIVPGRLKWALLAVTLLSIFLSWGKNMMWFTNLFLDWMPMYSKFRTVSSILVIAEFTIPVLAVLALKEWVEKPELLRQNLKAFVISLSATAGLALLFVAIPNTFFNFLSQQEAESFLPQAAGNPQIADVLNNLTDARIAIFRADAWRSIFIIALGVGMMVLYSMKKVNAMLFVVAVIALSIGDLGGVNKRYLNSSSFHEKRVIKTAFAKSPADEEILADSDPNFRVFDMSVNTFNDYTTSYYYKSVGGYHAAKLRRYQDLIEHQLATGNMNVLNMLNTKYFINAAPNTQQPVAVENPEALGNAWFVNGVNWVDNADDEMAALDTNDPRETAIIDKQFKEILPEIPTALSRDSLASITLTEYLPNKLVYKSQSDESRVAVFSEIYYPHGWKAFIDGEEVAIARANYVLRAVAVPAGSHEIVFTFYPTSEIVTERIAYTGIGLLVVLVLLSGFTFLKSRKEEVE